MKLLSSRSYTLTLSPQLVYAQSALLPALVSSQMHTQLEFQAVGSWWVYRDNDRGRTTASNQHTTSASAAHKPGMKSKLHRIPSGREDVFADDSLSIRDKRTLMKFLRHVLRSPNDESISDDLHQSQSLGSLLTSDFNVSVDLQDPLLALSLSYQNANGTMAKTAISGIRRHIRSMGVFSPAFGAVVSKYGGGAEVAQVGCRACAVGGGVYVLGRGVSQVRSSGASNGGAEANIEDEELVTLKLSDGEEILSRFVVGGPGDLPTNAIIESSSIAPLHSRYITHTVSIVSSSLAHLFLPGSENGPASAVAVVFFGEEELDVSDHGEEKTASSGASPVYLLVHSADTGECPLGHCESFNSFHSLIIDLNMS